MTNFLRLANNMGDTLDEILWDDV